MEELVPNTILSHYRIVSQIGAGGMGEVYLAQDTKLDRKVALKVLPAEVAANRNRMDRFVREAKAAAALNHPNIAHIYEIGSSPGTSPTVREGSNASSADNIHFIAMEFIDGVTARYDGFVIRYGQARWFAAVGLECNDLSFRRIGQSRDLCPVFYG